MPPGRLRMRLRYHSASIVWSILIWIALILFQEQPIALKRFSSAHRLHRFPVRLEGPPGLARPSLFFFAPCTTSLQRVHVSGNKFSSMRPCLRHTVGYSYCRVGYSHCSEPVHTHRMCRPRAMCSGATLRMVAHRRASADAAKGFFFKDTPNWNTKLKISYHETSGSEWCPWASLTYRISLCSHRVRPLTTAE